MPKLNEVVTAILSSLSSAQHQSNQVSSQFAKSYKYDETMKYFALPNATVSEAEITLRYAIKDMAIAAMPHLARELRTSSESRFAAHHRAINIINVLMREEKFRALFKGTDINAREIAMSHVDEISQVIYEGNKNNHAEEEIVADVIAILINTFEKYPTVAENFKSIFKNSDEMKEKAYACIKENDEEIAKMLQNSMQQNDDKASDSVNSTDNPPHIRQGFFQRFRRNKQVPPPQEEPPHNPNDIEIIIDNDILQKLPESIIQTIRFKTHIKNYHWIVNEKSNSGEFILTA